MTTPSDHYDVPVDWPLVVVRVEDAIDSRLAGHVGGVCESPPQTQEQALALVALLLGGRADSGSSRERWVAAIAGGRRIVTVARVSNDDICGGPSLAASGLESAVSPRDASATSPTSAA